MSWCGEMAETVFMKVAEAVSRLAWEGAGVLLGELCSFVKAASYGPVLSRKASEQGRGGRRSDSEVPQKEFRMAQEC